MYDGGKIIIGLIIFILLCTFPFWYNLGSAAYEAPELQMPQNKQECVKAASWMRVNHMDLLDTWRDEVVRNDKSEYISSTLDKKVEISLQNTCMDCHDNKQKFCDRCHNTASVEPYCWDCHVAPEEVGDGQ